MQMKLGKLLAETKTGEKRQIEPEKDGRGQKYEFELAGYHFFVRDMVKKTEESDKENQEYFITRRIVGKRKEASGKKEGIALSMYLESGRRCADHHLHRFSGSAADDPQHVQDRGRAAALRVPRFRPYRFHPRAEYLRRPLRRDGLPPDRLCHALRGQRAGGHGPHPCRPSRGADRQGPLHQLLRRLPHQPRDPEDRGLGL